MRSRIVGLTAHSVVAAVILSAIFTIPALAQDQTPPPPADTAPAPENTPVVPVAAEPQAAAPAAKESTQLDTIEVTGSRLKRTDYESAQPVVSISREDIERTGLTDISQILRQLTVAGNNSLTTQQGRFSTTLGETNLDLRNLGASHTLLLVNGRRWVTGLIATQPSVADFNTIPVAIIERVEVLKDGASAIYGSDAIGGVVNVITRKDYEGFGVTYQLGNYFQQGDGTNQQTSVSWGMNRQGSSLFLNLSYTDQDTAPVENRALTDEPSLGATRDSPVTTRGSFTLVNPAPPVASFYQCAVACVIQRNVDATTPPGTQPPLTDFHKSDINNPDDVFNRFADGTLTEPSQRSALYTQYVWDFMPHISFNFDGLYNYRKSVTVGQNGYVTGGNLSPGGKGYLAFIPASNPMNPFGQDIGKDGSCPDPESCTNVGTGSGVWRMRRAPGLNNGLQLDVVSTVRLGGGLKGDLDLFGQTLFWDGGYIYSTNKITDIGTTWRYDLLALEVGPAANCVSPCAPLDVFHGQGGLTEQALAFARYGAWIQNRNRQDIAYLDLSGELPLLPLLAGPISVATGVEFRRDGYSSTVDPILQQRLVAFLNGQGNTSGKTYAREAYLEFGLPLLEDLPGVRLLDLDIAGRSSQYPAFGNVTTGKAGLRWKPIEDLVLRTTYSTGFRAPNVGELFLGASQSYDGVADPCAAASQSATTSQNCATDRATGGGPLGQAGSQVPASQMYDLWIGNPDLKPETSKNLTYGLVYSPRFIPDLNVSLDFYDIKVKNFIVIGPSVGQLFIDSCYTQSDRQHCDAVNRDGQGNLVSIDTPFINFSAVNTSGIDGGIDYVLPLPGGVGRFKIALDASYLTKYDQIEPQAGQPDQVKKRVGTDTNLFEGFPRWKAGSALTWQRDLWRASWATRMAYTMTESCNDFFGQGDLTVAPAQFGACTDPDVTYDATGAPVTDNSKNRLATVFYHNVQLGRELPAWGADISFGINNVLNRDPPLSRSNIGIFWYNYDPNQYEVPGRFAYLRAGFKF